MAITRTTFQKLNRSLSKPHYSPSDYYDANNIRLSTDGTGDGLSTTAVINVKGNELAFTIPQTYEVYSIGLLTSGTDNINVIIGGTINSVFIDSALRTTIPLLAEQFSTALASYILAGTVKVQYNLTEVIIVSLNATMLITSLGPNTTPINPLVAPQSSLTPIGYGTIRGTIVLFTTNDNTPQGGIGQVWKLTYDNTVSPYVYTLELKYNNNVNFSTLHQIRAQGDYENELTQIIGFTDNFNSLRFFNIEDPNSFAIPITDLDNSPNVFFDIPVLYNIQGGGVLPIGTYQYAYRYSNVSGSTTPFSPVSAVINIITADEGAAYSSYYPQATAGTFPATAKSIVIRIDNIDERFTNIQVASIYRSTDGATPEVKLFQTVPVTQGPIYITNSGAENSTSLVIEDVLQNGNPFTTCKDITVKDSRLLAANTSNTKFVISDAEFDSRAYRFPAKPLNHIAVHGTNLQWNGGKWDGTNIIDNGTYIKVDSTSWVLSYTSDAINPNQTPQTTGTALNPTYKYQSDGNTIGGEGLHIKYRITNDTISNQLGGDNNVVNPTIATPFGKGWRNPIRSNNNFTLNGRNYPSNQFCDFISPYNQANYKGYQHEETYRFAIRFYDKKGKRSFDKWIADITMPTLYEQYANGVSIVNFCHTTVIGTTHYFRILGVEFTVTLPQSVKDKISGYEIVRLERTQNNKTILGAGLLYYNCIIGNTATVTPENVPTGGYGEGPISQNLFTIQSPDFKLNNFGGFQTGDQIRIAGTTLIDNQVTTSGYTFRKYYEIQPQRDVLNLVDAINVNNGSIINTVNLINGITLYNQRAYTASGTPIIESYGNNTVAVYTNSTLSAVASSFKPYVYYYRNLSKQYGGNTYSDRTNNLYISTNQFRTITDSSSLTNTDLVFGGDIFLSIYDTTKLFKNWNIAGGSGTKAFVTYMAVESTVNPEWRGGVPNVYEATINRDGIVEPGDVNVDTLAVYETTKTFPVYEQSNNVRFGYSQPLNFQNIDSNDCRIYASEVKFNGETTNSWSIFKTNNYKDVDNPYGPINWIGSYKGQVLYFQNSAFGMIPVNQRSLIQDNSGAPLLLGVGEVMSKHEYISTKTGCRHQYGINNHEYGVDFFDVNAMKLYRYDGQLKCLSNDGLEQEFAKRLTGKIKIEDNPIDSTHMGISVVYDYKYNESIFTFKDTTNKFTIAYSDSMSGFTSFYDYMSPIYISNKKDFFSPNFDNGVPQDIYRHNFGDYGKFYTVLFPSSITTLINPQSNITKTFDNLIIQSEVVDINNIQLNETIDKLECTNDYQTTGVITLNPNTSIKRRFRTWTTIIPRDAANAAYTTLSHPRMTDKYLLVKMIFTNNNNKKFILHDLVTAFRPIESLRGQINE